MVQKNDKLLGFNNDVTVNDLIAWGQKYNLDTEYTSKASIYMDICKKEDVNQVFAFAQYSKETGFLYKVKSAAGLDKSYCNPCGLKVTKGGGDFQSSAHKKFPNWETGIQAQVDHILLYAGHPSTPKDNTPDPRHFKFIKGTAKTVLDLDGKWASPKPKKPGILSYGESLLKMMDEIYEIADKRIKLEEAKEKENEQLKPKEPEIEEPIIETPKVNKPVKVYVVPSNLFHMVNTIKPLLDNDVLILNEVLYSEFDLDRLASNSNIELYTVNYNNLIKLFERR